MQRLCFISLCIVTISINSVFYFCYLDDNSRTSSNWGGGVRAGSAFHVHPEGDWQADSSWTSPIVPSQRRRNGELGAPIQPAVHATREIGWTGKRLWVTRVTLGRDLSGTWAAMGHPPAATRERCLGSCTQGTEASKHRQCGVSVANRFKRWH